MLKVSLSPVTPYLHDTLPVPYCGTGEEYSVYPGNVRTTRHKVSLEVRYDSESEDDAEEFRERLAGALRDAGIG